MARKPAAQEASNVDERIHNLGRIELIPIASIDTDHRYSTNVRKEVPESEVEAMMASIKEYGQREPIQVIEDPKSKTRYRAAGMCRCTALLKLGRQDVKACLVIPEDLGVETVAQAAAILRTLESSKRKPAFGERVRSIRQMRQAKVPEEKMANALLVSPAYVGYIIKVEKAIADQCPNWEDQPHVTGDVVPALATHDNIPEGFNSLVSTGKIGKRATEPNRGRGKETKKLFEGLFEKHPWLASLPWNDDEIGLSMSKKKAVAWYAWAAEFEKAYGLADDETPEPPADEESPDSEEIGEGRAVA